ncbi:hypothetical protein Sjap_013583 [Stephania japonica]|uniref:Protein TIC 100 n=1 Tax=Stephania japonica TaxID=461633 RepID=A0AAP0IY62_9MAGN
MANDEEPQSSDEAASSSSSSSDSEYGEEDELDYSSEEDETKDDDSPENNIRRFSEVLDSESVRKKQEEEDKDYVYYEDLFDFPKDPERWREEDLRELWGDAPLEATKPGWDPVWADEEDWEIVQDEVRDGRDPPIAPFYLPYRKYYPAIPDNHYDISNPKAVIEELDRIEEFLKWVSYIFPDGSTYEGTVWDDLAHGKGVYVAEHGLVSFKLDKKFANTIYIEWLHNYEQKYEGEWLQNNMEGHGVVEVEIPSREPLPGSKLEAKMRSEGKIITRDFMSPEDREWLEMDIEDSYRLANGRYEIPFDENEVWIRQFGQKPEKGRYRYAGQWKHGRMHGCGVYEVNEQPIYGRFYFGELVDDDPSGCDEDTSALHAGIAEVAAAKARMFVNKPDGMVREQKGPYSDPQHPYFYEGEDVWMAPGFINQFHEVPDYWKTYVHEVDQEREMWLNSFYKAPLRLPMPAELEYWWSQDETPEFVLVNKEPEPDPNDPSKLIYKEDPLILHTRTGRLINYIDDEKHGIRLFWQPPLKEGEDIDTKKAEFLPLGFDEFFGKTTETVKKKGGIWERFGEAFETTIKLVLDKVEKWAEEKKKSTQSKVKLIEQELELVEAEICLEEAIEDLEAELKRKQKEEEKKAEMGQLEEEDTPTSVSVSQDGGVSAENEDAGEEEEEEDEDDGEPSSFGSFGGGQSQTNGDKGSKSGKSPFSSTSLSFTSCSLLSTVPSMLHQSFLSWKSAERSPTTTTQPIPTCCKHSIHSTTYNNVSFPSAPIKHKALKATNPTSRRSHRRNANVFQLRSWSSNRRKGCPRGEKSSNHQHSQTEPGIDIHNVLSLQIPIKGLESCMNCVHP